MTEKAFGFETDDVEFPTGAEGETFHLGSLKNSLPKHWLLPGSWERAESIIDLWDDVNDNPCPLVTRPHQYHMLTGTYKSVEMGICSTGIGSSAAEIAITELIYGGGRNFIRVGTSGCLDPEIMAGDLVIIQESRGNAGTIMEYLGRERMFGYIPSTPEVVGALEQACRSLGLVKIYREHQRGKGFEVGRGYCADSFYNGQGRSALCGLTEEMNKLVEGLIKESVLTIEMESPGAAAIIQAYRERAPPPYNNVGFATVLVPLANRTNGDWNDEKKYQMQALKVASEALVLLD